LTYTEDDPDWQAVVTPRTPTTAAGRRLVADATDHPIWASAMPGYVLAIEAEADDQAYERGRAEGLAAGLRDANERVAEARASLDGERLARAFWGMTGKRMVAIGYPWFDWDSPESDKFRAGAVADGEELAREYAALEDPTPEEPTPPSKPAWVGVPDANGDIHCSRLAPQRCMWLEGHYGGCATP